MNSQKFLTRYLATRHYLQLSNIGAGAGSPATAGRTGGSPAPVYSHPCTEAQPCPGCVARMTLESSWANGGIEPRYLVDLNRMIHDSLLQYSPVSVERRRDPRGPRAGFVRLP